MNHTPPINEFTANMDMSWDAASDVFGEPVVLNGYPCRAIVHNFVSIQQVGNSNNRSREVQGTMIIHNPDWIKSGAKQGSVLTIPSMPHISSIRVGNEPATNRSSMHVDLVATVRN